MNYDEQDGLTLADAPVRKSDSFYVRENGSLQKRWYADLRETVDRDHFGFDLSKQSRMPNANSIEGVLARELGSFLRKHQ